MVVANRLTDFMRQNILTIECSSELCSVALSCKHLNKKVIFREHYAPREHAYLVLPFVESLLEELRLDYAQLEGVAFGQGPGAFTGLRVAASMAQGLAAAYELPLLSGCSLLALARQAQQLFPVQVGDAICATLDARMSELYWIRVEKTAQGFAILQQAQLGSPEHLLESLDRPHYLLGPGCRYLIDLIDEKKSRNYQDLSEAIAYYPHAKDLLFSLSSESSQTNSLPMPVYLRNNVANKAKLSP